MNLFLERLADLLKVKTFVTFSVVLVFAVLALKGKIQTDNVMVVVSMVVSFYFGTQHEKKAL
jgi:hypothetical protein